MREFAQKDYDTEYLHKVQVLSSSPWKNSIFPEWPSCRPDMTDMFPDVVGIISQVHSL